MNRVSGIRHQVAIAGKVVDVQTSGSLRGAWVEIETGPAVFNELLAIHRIQFGDRWPTLAERLDRTRTSADGAFQFLDLPGGRYTLKISLPSGGSRYGTAQAQAMVVVGANGKITFETTTIALPSTTVKGRITGPGAGPLQMAEVRIRGSGERAFSDAQGEYLLAGLEKGTRTVLVSAQGFQPAAQNVVLNEAGAVQTLNVALTRPPPP
ncbi:MAG TPA: carboxypeptidase-like regulatory domain-containing protein [Blastocatellia bacterium]|nr:carboxypeptidase-like regulatory domain-containing protein [Blastocatellia bacterium]